jgi:hypothetical protein
MQSLAQRSSIGTSYSAAQVAAFLTQNDNSEQWVVDRLNMQGQFEADISNWVDMGAMTNTATINGNQMAPVSGQRSSASVATITHDTTQSVKRQLSMRLEGNVTLNPLKDLIRFHYQLQTPDGGWLDWVLGTFVLTIPDLEINPGFSFIQCAGTDVLQLLVDAAVPITWTVPAGTGYIDAVRNVINTYGGSYKFDIQIQAANQSLQASQTWDAGTSRLTIINDLLETVNYQDLWADELGVLRSNPIPNYANLTPSFTFDGTGDNSIIGYPLQLKTDLSNAYNQVLIVGADPRVATFNGKPIFNYKSYFNYVYQNNDPTSPISVPNWHPKLIAINDNSIPNAAVAAAKAKTLAQQYALVFNQWTLNTFPWPVSQNYDIYQCIIDTPDHGLINAKFLEIGWTHQCSTAGATSHVLTQVTGSEMIA